jgi:hypothetical protein
VEQVGYLASSPRLLLVGRVGYLVFSLLVEPVLHRLRRIKRPQDGLDHFLVKEIVHKANVEVVEDSLEGDTQLFPPLWQAVLHQDILKQAKAQELQWALHIRLLLLLLGHLHQQILHIGHGPPKQLEQLQAQLLLALVAGLAEEPPQL